MRFVVRTICALGAAIIFVWGMHTASQPTFADFVASGWSKQGPVSPEHPLVVDAEAREIRVYARVNGKYFHLPTRHGMNYRAGAIGNKSLFRAWANPIDFYHALISLGAKPGQNLGAGTGGQTVKGAHMAVSVTWQGAPHPYPINQVVADSGGEGVAYRFGGNIKIAKKAKTGCLMCFDSCPVGILSNALYPQGAFHARGLAFRGRPEVLPPDGTPVTVIIEVGAS